MDMDETTINLHESKTPSKGIECLLCSNTTKRLHCLVNFKARKENYISTIETFTSTQIPKGLLDVMHACEACINKCKNALSLKETFTSNINLFIVKSKQKKRMPSTPLSDLKTCVTDNISSPASNINKLSVAEEIQRSVEKLKSLSLSSNMPQKRSRQRLTFEDHGYSKTTLSDLKTGVTDNIRKSVAMPESLATSSPSSNINKLSAAKEIQRSVEKLKSLSLSSNMPQKKSRQRLTFEDHGYSKTTSCTEAVPVSAQFSSTTFSSSDAVDEDECSQILSSRLSAEEFISKELVQHSRYSALASCVDNSVKTISKFGQSILYIKNPSELCKRDWFRDATLEMLKTCPELFAVLFSALGNKVSAENKISAMAIMYGMILHSRNVKACAIQRIITSLCIRFHADNQLLERLNFLHVTLSHETKRNILKDFCSYADLRIIEHLSKGNDFKINGDNLDIYVHTNDIRMNNKNKDYHFFASDVIFDRLSTDGLDNSKSLLDIEDVTWKNFVPSENEDGLFKNSLKVLLGRILGSYIPKFEWLKSILPLHIPHPMEDVMSNKSIVCWLPVMMKNEACYADCIQIMKSYEDMILKWYSKCGRACDLDDLKVPVGGDQLTRVRLQGAKAVQDGALTPSDRMEHLEPIIVEMFHTLQDFLEKMYKRFYKTTSGRDKGSLYNLKIAIERSNVNGNVKSRFEAHEDFAITVGHGYFLSYVMNKLGMDSLNSDPKHQILKDNMKYMHNKYKENIFHALMDEIVDELVCLFPKEDPGVLLNVQIGNGCYFVKSQVEGAMLKFEMMINNRKFVFNVTREQAQNGAVIPIPVGNNMIPVKISLKKESSDDLYNYVVQYLQWFFIILTFQDAIREGDSERTNITLKFCIPIFFSCSKFSKYLEECVDYILKTEILLTEKLAMKTRYGSFVNMKGRKGCNKATDLQKENEVLVLKELIRGLGSNKTEKAIITATAAAPVIQDIVDNFDRITNIASKTTRHKKRSLEDDVKCILKVITPLRIWDYTNGRCLENFSGLKKSPFDIDRQHFKQIINKKVERLRRGISIPSELESESDSEN